MKQWGMAIIFFLVESVTTALLISVIKYLSRPNGHYAELEVLFRNAIGLFLMRIYLLQAVVEIIFIFLIIRFGGWDKYWLVIFGVFASTVVWGGLWGSMFGFDFRWIKLAVFSHGVSLFFGALMAWLLCIKWNQ